MNDCEPKMRLPIKCPECWESTIVFFTFTTDEIPLVRHLFFPMKCAVCGHQHDFRLRLNDDKEITILIVAPAQMTENVKWEFGYAVKDKDSAENVQFKITRGGDNDTVAEDASIPFSIAMWVCPTCGAVLDSKTKPLDKQSDGEWHQAFSKVH